MIFPIWIGRKGIYRDAEVRDLRYGEAELRFTLTYVLLRVLLDNARQ